MTTKAAPKAPYAPVNPGFGFTDVPEKEYDYPFPVLTLEQRMRFELFGYTVVEDLFSEEELGSIEAVAGQVKGELLEAAGDDTFAPLPPPEKYRRFRDGAKWRGNRTRTASGGLHLDRLEIESVLGLDPVFLSVLGPASWASPPSCWAAPSGSTPSPCASTGARRTPSSAGTEA